MIEQIKHWDEQLFLWLNELHSEWLDQPMYFMSEKLVWIPVYIFLLVLIYRAYGLKTSIWTLVGVALVITLADRISVELFKEVFQRYRPTHNLNIGNLVHTVNDYRGGKYGFVSSHSANFFGVAAFLYPMLKKTYGKRTLWIFAWAGLIAYTRIYLGVHYPADVVVGGLLGIIIGYVVYLVFQKYLLYKD